MPVRLFLNIELCMEKSSPQKRCFALHGHQELVSGRSRSQHGVIYDVFRDTVPVYNFIFF